MNPNDWLLLTDYASKYRISVSTLRRRIKSGVQPYRFDGGRYYLPDILGASVPGGAVEEKFLAAKSAATPSTISTQTSTTQQPARDSAGASSGASSAAAILAASIAPKDEPLITTTSKLLNELKQAYTLILHEKEEQIVYLKEEIADLKTLVRVLESENARHVSDRDRRRSDPTSGNTAKLDRRPPDKGSFGNA